MKTNNLSIVSAGLAIVITSSLLADEPSPAHLIFTKVQLDSKFRSEGVAVGDFNRDGRMDIAAGRVFYVAPRWTMYSMLESARDFDPKGYSGSFCNFAEDVNGDGWVDVIVVDFPGTPTYWYENPKKLGARWPQHVCCPVSNNESPQYVDLDGDGQRELVMAVAPSTAQSDGPDRQMAFLKPTADANRPWKITPISIKGGPNTTKYSHGLGIGDVNGDGRKDILVPQGWWEAPQDRGQIPWPFHPASFGDPCAHMYVYDVDGDGDNDVVSSSAHNYGVWWHQQTPDGWRTHEIDKSFSQTHALCFADINGDGLPELITGKRWWAHGGRDPGGNEPAVFFWFQLTREGRRPRWIRHQFDHDSGPGTQFEVVDVNGDGRLDIVTSNKKGVHLFQQQRR